MTKDEMKLKIDKLESAIAVTTALLLVASMFAQSDELDKQTLEISKYNAKLMGLDLTKGVK